MSLCWSLSFFAGSDPIVPLDQQLWLCLSVPHPIMALVQAQYWTDLILLGRWLKQSSFHDCSNFQKASLRSYPLAWFADWPDQDWLNTTSAQGCEVPRASKTVRAADLRHAEHVLQKCVPIVLANAINQEEKQSLEYELCQAVETLQSLNGGCSSRLRHVRHTGSQLLAALDMSVLLRSNASSLREICEKALITLDPSLRGLIADRLSTLPSSRSVRRHMLTLDASLILFEKEYCQAFPTTIRYGWADSSPLGGYEWLWCKHTKVRALPSESLGILLQHYKDAVCASQQAMDEDEPIDESTILVLKRVAACFAPHTHVLLLA